MDLTRAERLQAYIDAARDEPAVWGESDCCSWPATWAAQEIRRPVDLPKYRTREEAFALIGQAGGLVSLASNILAKLQLMRTDMPVLGDIGIIQMSDGPVGVIFCHGGVAVWRCQTGTVFLRPVPRTILAAWSV